MSAVRMTTDERLEQLLADGYSHTRDEMMAHVGDPLMEINAFKQLVHRLRKRLMTSGRGVVCIGLPVENKTVTHYQIIKINRPTADN